MTSAQMDRHIFQIPAIVRGWNAAAKREGIDLNGRLIGAHSNQNTMLNLGLTVTKQDTILQASGS